MFCSNCGNQIPDGTKFCPNCGAATGENAAQASAPVVSGQDNSKTMAILAVIFPVLFFLPLVVQPKTEFGTFWANQALLLLLLGVIAGIIPIIGAVIGIFEFVLWIMAIVNVCKGEMKPLPLIGSISIIK